jgi:hypothetical protein
MPQITAVRVVRRRSAQPAQFESAAAEVELTGTILDNENYIDVARELLVESRALVYENLGLPLPPRANKKQDAEEMDTAEETATVEVITPEATTAAEVPVEEPAKKADAPKKKPGRPAGAKNKPKPVEVVVPKDEVPDLDASEVPGGEATNVETVPLDVIPDDKAAAPAEVPVESPATGDTTPSTSHLTGDGLQMYIVDKVKNKEATADQVMTLRKELGLASFKEVTDVEQLTAIQARVDDLVLENAVG